MDDACLPENPSEPSAACILVLKSSRGETNAAATAIQ